MGVYYIINHAHINITRKIIMGKVKEIKKRAYNDGIESLTPKEMVLYLIFRVKNLLSKNFLLSRFELEYLL